MDSMLNRLYEQRDLLYQQLAKTGDFRRGSINTLYRRCGKSNCACAQPDHPGHGPQYLLTTKVNGKTVSKNLRVGPQLEQIKLEVSNHRKFREVIRDITELNERICELKDPQRQADAQATAKKGASKPNLPQQSPQS